MKKIIPKAAFQAISLVIVLPVLGLAGYWCATETGLYFEVARLTADDRGMYDPFFAGLLTFVGLLLAATVPILLLRPFADMPSVSEQWRTDPLLKRLGALGGAGGPGGPPDPMLAPVGRRVLACAIDRAIVVVVILAGVVPAMLLEKQPGLAIAVASPALLVGVLYAYIRDAVRGQSIGRRFLGLRVVDLETREPIGAWRSFKRELPLHFAPTMAIEVALLIASKDRRRLGDLWAKTVVVRTDGQTAASGRAGGRPDGCPN